MATPAFDTLKFANRPKAADVPDKHAEAEAEALSELFELNLRELATKEDLQWLRKDLGELERRLETKIEMRAESVKYDMIKWIAGMLLAQAGLIAALVKLL